MKKVNIIIGRFQPFTAGHYVCVTTANKKKKLPTVICMVDTPESKVDNRHPFPTSMLLNAYKKFFDNDPLIKEVITVKSADIVNAAKALKERGYQIASWTCGTDRFSDYSKMAEKYHDAAGLSDDFECIEVPRTDEDISATKARNCLLNDDKDGFFKLMPNDLEKSDELYNTLKAQMEAAKDIEPKKKTAKKKASKESLVFEYRLARLTKKLERLELECRVSKIEQLLSARNKQTRKFDF